MSKFIIRKDTYSVSQIVDKLRSNELKFNMNGKVEPSLIELLMQHSMVDAIVAKTLPNDEGMKIFNGFTLLRTLNYYIIENNPLENLQWLPDFEEFLFSDLPRSYQRRVEESDIDVYLDDSLDPDNEELIERYANTLNNSKE